MTELPKHLALVGAQVGCACVIFSMVTCRD